MTPDRDALPSKLIGVHLGYRSRAVERGRMPSEPSYFLKATTSLAGPQDDVVCPQDCVLLGFEGEVALIIGRTPRSVTPDEAWACVSGVAAANDFGVHDLRYADPGSNVHSKGFDTFTPIGDPLDARVVAPRDVRLRTWVNGELRQDAAVEDLLFSFGYLIADLSRVTTLLPGDIVLTGTPTGAGVAEPGDLVEVEVCTPAGRSSVRNVVTRSSTRLTPYGAMPRQDDETRRIALGSMAGQASSGELSADVRAGLDSVATATLASQLTKRGLHGLILDALVAVHPGQRFVGRARTLRYLPFRTDLRTAKADGHNAQKAAVEGLRPGEVLVIDAGGEPNAGTIGDILALRAKVLGASAIITDGAIRDSAAIRDLELPVYHRSVHPSVLQTEHLPWERDVAVRCAGVLVQPHDLLVGDADGVVVLPEALISEIVLASLEQEREERFIADQVALGRSIRGLYPLGQEAREEFEVSRSGSTTTELGAVR